MKYTMKPKVIASDLVVKCIMSGVFILFMVVSVPLFSESLFLGIIIYVCLLIGLVIFVKSVLWDIFGKEEIAITEEKLIIDRILLLSKRSIVVPIEDITSINHTPYTKKADSDIFFNSISLWRYLASIVTFNKGYITVKTHYRSYSFCPDIFQRESIMVRIIAKLNLSEMKQ